ncbi:MAG: hypothetical protein LBG27_05825 [Spirochaetaceae bacterium]|jgi:hypothetical protein|nr:hypothetical protein [Spirochaetaceae bacterium]
MVDTNEWYASFQQALEKRREWLSHTRMPALKAGFGDFRTIYATLYSILLQKNSIVKDPYKGEASAVELRMPETSPFFEPKKREEFSLRLAKYDNQLEYIAAFHDFSVDTFTPDKIKILQATIWFIAWKNLSLTSPSSNTQAMAEIFFNLRNGAANKTVLGNLEACFDVLYNTASRIDEMLNELNDYQREAYKGRIRSSITANMDGVVTLDAIKQRFPAVFPGEPFHRGLVQELLNEDYSPDAQIVREGILTKLAVTEHEAPVVGEVQSFKAMLIEGLKALGSTGDTFHEIVVKIGHNHGVYRRKKKSPGETMKAFFALLFKRRRAADFYECEIVSAIDSRVEIIDHHVFVEELNKKVKELRAITAGVGHTVRLEKMDETELLDYLGRSIRDIQKYHRLLIALDSFFKTKVNANHRSHIKGMRPELSTIKAALSKAVVKHEYYLVNQK